MMAIRVKPIDVVSKKWVERASIASEDYKTGIELSGDAWQKNTEAAFERWAAGVQEAIRDKRFLGGVRAAGNEKWRRNAVELGPRRYAEGVRAAVDEYRSKMDEVLRVIASIDLPPKGPRGDDRNWERSKIVGKTLHAWKVAKKRA